MRTLNNTVSKFSPHYDFDVLCNGTLPLGRVIMMLKNIPSWRHSESLENSEMIQTSTVR